MKREIKSAILSITVGLLIGAMLKFFVLDIVHVRGSSMEPTFTEGDAALVNKLAYGIVRPFGDSLICIWREPEAGDIVIYMHEGNLVIKRCVAVQASPLDFSCDKGYTLRVNGQTFPLSEAQYSNMALASRVPDGMILAVGDNPAASIDSRDYGFIPVRNVLARAVPPRKASR
ncbi:MAG: signal peptidase I [Treponema sp.]|nr:signal peptidase I [Treponema sp.]